MYASFNARAVGLGHLGAINTIQIAAETGFAGVDLMVRDIARLEVPATSLRARMDDLNLKAGAFPFPIDWRPDNSAFLRHLEELPRILEVAHALGLKRTGTWVMPETSDRLKSRSEVKKLHVSRLGKVARLMRAFGIRVGLEIIGVESFRSGHGQPFVTRLADLNQELGEIWNESDNFGILLDVFHLYAANESIEAGLSWGVEKIAWAHVADLPPGATEDRSAMIDANRGLPGENGAVDVRGFLARLSREGYDGPVTAEPLSNCSSLQGLEPLDVARRVKQSLDLVWPRD